MRSGVYWIVLRPWFILCCLLLATCALAQVKDNRLGLTRDQILAMGDDRWFDLFAKKKGEEPAMLTIACQTYADALHDRNIERLKKEKDKARLERWYEQVKAYGEAMFKIQSRTGGDVWEAVEAAQNVDIEELLDQLENLQAKPDPKKTPNLEACANRVLAHHDLISTRIKQLPEEGVGYLGREKLAEFNSRGEKRLQALIPELEKFGGQEAYLVFVTCSKLSDPLALFLNG